MFEWLTNILTTSKPICTSGLQRGVPIVRARYDAAVTHDANYRHWANTPVRAATGRPN